MDSFELGKKITELRKMQKISQIQMAEDLGISRVTIAALEKSAIQDVGVKKLIKMLDYLGYSLGIKPKAKFPTLEDLQDE
ncbi:hypothetical protein SPONN_2074 [uncultured Candidatus Thioglobus sp.]|nr:hypothetical protein SPONN_2074 [uncultured Candidatus Thioglobus sp.]